jgi:hypothetical protein
MYQAPDGVTWLKRDGGPAQRHPSCP